MSSGARKRGQARPVSGLALLALLVWALPAAGQVPDPRSRCGTPEVIGGLRPVPEDEPVRGRGRPPGMLKVPVSAPGPGEATALPAQAAPPTTQAGPSGGPPPPAVPGLAPGSPSGKDEEKRDRVEAIQAKGEVPEERLLDVGIEIFDPGASEADREKLERSGLSPELRRSEARYISFELKRTLEGTGNWGAVRVVPAAAEGLDLWVSGSIDESNGKRLALEIEARDALGRRRLRKFYRGEADTSAYRTERLGRQEPFQGVYNRIANDLLKLRDELDPDELLEVHRVATLRFASQLAPEAFRDYLKAKGPGRYELARFPAQDDPMLGRVLGIRERDQMLVDTLNERYLSFYERMSGPYANWRMYSYQEQDALDRIRKESLLKKLLGGAAVLAGVLMSPESSGGRVAQDAAILGGMAAVQAGFRQSQEAAVHTAALKELASSFDGDVAPLLVEVEGQQQKLTGSAEAQFLEWRELLRRVFSLETGAPADPNATVGAAPPPSD